MNIYFEKCLTDQHGVSSKSWTTYIHMICNPITSTYFHSRATDEETGDERRMLDCKTIGASCYGVPRCCGNTACFWEKGWSPFRVSSQLCELFFQLYVLPVQHSYCSTQSWGSVLPSIVETRDQNSQGCPLLFSNRNLGSFCA